MVGGRGVPDSRDNRKQPMILRYTFDVDTCRSTTIDRQNTSDPTLAVGFTDSGHVAPARDPENFRRRWFTVRVSHKYHRTIRRRKFQLLLSRSRANGSRKICRGNKRKRNFASVSSAACFQFPDNRPVCVSSRFPLSDAPPPSATLLPDPAAIFLNHRLMRFPARIWRTQRDSIDVRIIYGDRHALLGVHHQAVVVRRATRSTRNAAAYFRPQHSFEPKTISYWKRHG